MKKLLIATALVTGLSATAFAVENSVDVRDNQKSVSRFDQDATRNFGASDGNAVNGTYYSTRSMCDPTANGAAKLDACSPDGMAAGGSNNGSRNSRQ